jgi:hypothetical protein
VPGGSGGRERGCAHSLSGALAQLVVVIVRVLPRAWPDTTPLRVDGAEQPCGVCEFFADREAQGNAFEARGGAAPVAKPLAHVQRLTPPVDRFVELSAQPGEITQRRQCVSCRIS